MRVPAWLLSLAVGGVLAPSTIVLAQTSPPPPEGTLPAATPPPAPPAAPARSWRDLIAVEGLMDSYFSYRPGGAGNEDASPGHVFDQGSDSFVLAYTELAVTVRPEPVGLRLDLGFGPVADLTASTIPGAAGGAPEVYKHLQQAYVSFATNPGIPLTIDVGKFVTSAGAEVIEAHSNWNYSRSFMFAYAIPFTHTGVRVTTPILNNLTLQGMLVNGWDISYDFGRAKTFGLGATYIAPFGTTFALNMLSGIESQGADAPWRLLADLVVSHTVGPLSLMANVDLAKEGSATWWGLAGYARVAAMEHLNLSLRGEIFHDGQGARIASAPPNVGTTVEEFTATAGIPIGSNGELRGEFRGDFANRGLYLVDAGLKTSQFQLLAAALAWF